MLESFLNLESVKFDLIEDLDKVYFLLKATTKNDPTAIILNCTKRKKTLYIPTFLTQSECETFGKKAMKEYKGYSIAVYRIKREKMEDLKYIASICSENVLQQLLEDDNLNINVSLCTMSNSGDVLPLVDINKSKSDDFELTT